MDYLCYGIVVEEELKEQLLAFLAYLPFDSFEEVDTGLKAYLPATAAVEETDAQMDGLAQRYRFTYTKQLIPHQNWNAVWESNFTPIQIGHFCLIRAEFHNQQEGFQYEIVIRPKMAFGTGHHATTYMMIAAMQNLPLKHATVFDYGCGTGILALLADMMGAKRVDAVDIEYPAYQNTLENALLNNCKQINTYHGGMDALPEQEIAYDIILANINRNVILDSLASLYAKMKPAGVLLVSGILLDDRALVTAKAKASGFELATHWTKGNWCCLQFSK
jgi:ribosomal protein L11 methyltransferase